MTLVQSDSKTGAKCYVCMYRHFMYVIYVRMYGWMDRLMYACTVCMYTCMYGWMHVQYLCIYVWMD